MSYQESGNPFNSYLASEKVARLNDYFYRSEKDPKPKTLTAKLAQTFLGRTIRVIGQRGIASFVGTFIFPLFLSMDLGRNTFKGLQHRATALFLKDESEKTAQAREAAKCDRAAKLILISIPTTILTSVFVPHLVSRHYVNKKAPDGIIQAGGKLHFAIGTPIFPTTLEEVAGWVMLAKQEGKKVTIIGAGYSQSGDTLPTHHKTVVINMSKIRHVHIDKDQKTVRAGAGATWFQIMELLNQEGLCTIINQASSPFGVGGSLGVACHGWSLLGMISQIVQSMKVITAEGEIKTVLPGDELFRLCIGGHGMFGIIGEATLQVADNEMLTPHVAEVDLESYAAALEKNPLSTTVLSLGRMILDPRDLLGARSGKIMQVSYQRQNGPVSAVKSTRLLQEPPYGFVFSRVVLHIARTINIARIFMWGLQKKAMFKEVEAPRNEIMNPEVLCAFDAAGDACWLQEYFVKAKNLADFSRFLGNLLMKHKVKLFNASIRFVPANDNIVLTYAPKQDHFAIVLFFHQSLVEEQIKITRDWVREVIQKLASIDGTFYLPYARLATRAQFEKIYNSHGQLDEAKRLKQVYDPEERFYSQFYEHYLAHDPLEELKNKRLTNLKRLAADSDTQLQFKDFLTEVLVQLDPTKFYQLLDKVLNQRELTYEEAYQEVLEKIGEAKRGAVGNVKDLLKSVKKIKQVIGKRTAELLGQGGTVEGYVEIGSPGRNLQAIQKYAHVNFKGPKIVVNDAERLSDYAQTGIGRRPYDQFIALGDYTPLTDRVKKGSVELVVCTIGLHHIAQEKLAPFIASLREILKPGGSLILRDHDVCDLNSELMAELAHTVFNLANGIPFQGPEGELEEIRNFKSMQSWIEALQNFGFGAAHNDLRLADDSSRNTLIRMIKLPEIGEELSALETLIKTEGQTRPLEQTYYTTLEWHLVHVAQEYAAFLQNHPVQDFPFLKHVSILMKAFMNSIQKGKKENPSAGLFSEYMMMNYFMLVCTSPELLLKALVYAPLKIWPGASAAEQLSSQKLLLKMSQKYAKFIETTPSYQFPQWPWMKAALQNFSSKHFLVNSYINNATFWEALVKLITLAPINALYNDRAIENDRIDFVVHASQERINHLSQEYNWESFTEDQIKLETLQSFGGYTRVRTTRYYPLRNFLIKCAMAGIQVLSIAGQKKIQVKVKAPRQNEVWKNLPGASLIQRIEIPTDKICDYQCLDVEIEQLHNVLAKLENAKIEITYIHDF